MKLSIVTGALVLGSLAAAGNSLAIVEAVSMYGSFVESGADAALDFASQAQADVQAKASLAEAVAANLLGTTHALTAMEYEAAMGAAASADDCVHQVELSQSWALQQQACAIAFLNGIVAA